MTIRELKENIKNEPDDKLVILSKDAEGNNFSPLVQVSNSFYVPITNWYGELSQNKDGIDKPVPCLCLWPTN